MRDSGLAGEGAACDGGPTEPVNHSHEEPLPEAADHGTGLQVWFTRSARQEETLECCLECYASQSPTASNACQHVPQCKADKQEYCPASAHFGPCQLCPLLSDSRGSCTCQTAA